MGERTLTVLIVGKSGAGKSEFARSFIDERGRTRILTSGEGQTTRFDIEYHIFRKRDDGAQVEVKIKTKTEFVEDRMNAVKEVLSDIRDREDLDILKIKLIHSNEDFDCNEFTVGEEIDEKFRTCFQDIVPINDLKITDYVTICQCLGVKTSRKYENEGTVAFDDLLVVYLEWVYDRIISCVRVRNQHIADSNQLVDISGESADEMEKFFKVNTKNESYSAIVSKVIIKAAVRSEYADLFSVSHIETLVIIDTRGLDHSHVADDEVVIDTYKKLLSIRYPEVTSVLFLRDVSATDSVADIGQSVSLLFRVKRDIMSYVVFTKVDKCEDTDSNHAIAEIRNSSSNTCMEIRKELKKYIESQEYRTIRVKVMSETAVEYCSIDEGNYILNNVTQLRRLFTAINAKSYMGESIVEVTKVKLLKNSFMEQVFCAKKIFTSENADKSINRIYGWTIRKIADCMMRGCTDGYIGARAGIVGAWKNYIGEYFKNSFSNIECRTRVFGFSEAVSVAIQSCLDELVNDMIVGCNTDTMDKMIDLFKNASVPRHGGRQRIELMKAEPENEKKEWVLEIYDFADTIQNDDQNAICMQDTTMEELFDLFVKKLRYQYNARKMAEIKNNENKSVESIVNEYEENQDKELTEDERILLIKSIKDYIE